jgi:hypothetical protein
MLLMLSVPPTTKTSPCPAHILACASVRASRLEAQLRCTVIAGFDSGRPARRAMTRAMFMASGGCPTQPMMVSSTSIGSMPVRVRRAATAWRPSSTASRCARSVPARENGVRTAETMTREGVFMALGAECHRGYGGLGFGAMIDEFLLLQEAADAELIAHFGK